jgi:hypothetical protein
VSVVVAPHNVNATNNVSAIYPKSFLLEAQKQVEELLLEAEKSEKEN